MSSILLPPLVPKVDAILVLDGDGNRLAGKYYGDFLKIKQGDKTREELRVLFEQQLQNKITGIAARPDAAEVVTCQGRTAVFCGGNVGGHNGGGGGTSDVRVVHIGPPGESELVLAHLCEGMYDALNRLMGGVVDRNMVLDNLELVFLLIDEHCDGGFILEVNGSKLASAVLLRDSDENNGIENGGGMKQGGGAAGVPQGSASGGGVNPADMTIGQAFRQVREQLMAGMNSRDGM